MKINGDEKNGTQYIFKKLAKKIIRKLWWKKRKLNTILYTSRNMPLPKFNWGEDIYLEKIFSWI